MQSMPRKRWNSLERSERNDTQYRITRKYNALCGTTMPYSIEETLQDLSGFSESVEGILKDRCLGLHGRNLAVRPLCKPKGSKGKQFSMV